MSVLLQLELPILLYRCSKRSCQIQSGLTRFVNLKFVSAAFIRLMQIQLYLGKKSFLLIHGRLLAQFKESIADLSLEFAYVRATTDERLQQSNCLIGKHLTLLTKIALSAPLYPPLLGESGGSWGAPPDPRQRGFAPCGIPIFILRGAGGKPAWGITPKIHPLVRIIH